MPNQNSPPPGDYSNVENTKEKPLLNNYSNVNSPGVASNTSTPVIQKMNVVRQNAAPVEETPPAAKERTVLQKGLNWVKGFLTRKQTGSGRGYGRGYGHQTRGRPGSYKVPSMRQQQRALERKTPKAPRVRPSKVVSPPPHPPKSVANSSTRKGILKKNKGLTGKVLSLFSRKKSIQFKNTNNVRPFNFRYKASNVQKTPSITVQTKSPQFIIERIPVFDENKKILEIREVPKQTYEKAKEYFMKPSEIEKIFSHPLFSMRSQLKSASRENQQTWRKEEMNRQRIEKILNKYPSIDDTIELTNEDMAYIDELAIKDMFSVDNVSIFSYAQSAFKKVLEKVLLDDEGERVLFWKHRKYLDANQKAHLNALLHKRNMEVNNAKTYSEKRKIYDKYNSLFTTKFGKYEKYKKPKQISIPLYTMEKKIKDMADRIIGESFTNPIAIQEWNNMEDETRKNIYDNALSAALNTYKTTVKIQENRYKLLMLGKEIYDEKKAKGQKPIVSFKDVIDLIEERRRNFLEHKKLYEEAEAKAEQEKKEQEEQERKRREAEEEQERERREAEEEEQQEEIDRIVEEFRSNEIDEYLKEKLRIMKSFRRFNHEITPTELKNLLDDMKNLNVEELDDISTSTYSGRELLEYFYKRYPQMLQNIKDQANDFKLISKELDKPGLLKYAGKGDFDGFMIYLLFSNAPETLAAQRFINVLALQAEVVNREFLAYIPFDQILKVFFLTYYQIKFKIKQTYKRITNKK